MNGLAGDASDRVVLGAVVSVAPLPPEVTHLEPDASVAFDILFEDDELLVVDKPGGMVVHPSRGHAEKTLVHGLLARGSFARWPPQTENPWPACARESCTDSTKEPAVCWWWPRPSALAKGSRICSLATISSAPIGPLSSGLHVSKPSRLCTGVTAPDRLKFTSRVSSGKRAVTRVRVLEKLQGGKATLVECRLETGRTHQIRVHLCEVAGTPILGDPLYGRTPSDPELRELALRLGRQALHAAVLGFVHPVTGEKLRFEPRSPRGFQPVLRRCVGERQSSRMSEG